MYHPLNRTISLNLTGRSLVKLVVLSKNMVGSKFTHVYPNATFFYATFCRVDTVDRIIKNPE